MNIFNEKLLFELEGKYSELLHELGLPDGNNRFKEAFDNYKKLTEEMNHAGTTMIPEKWSEKFKHAVYDLTELMDIYNSVKDYPNKKLLKDKIDKMNGGLSSPANETSGNNIARNTQFELKLYSEFTEAGVECRLCDPIPDISIAGSHDRGPYAIECKRIFSFSDSSVHDAINSARDQLKRSLMDNPSQTGIIALDITRRLTRGTHYLRAKNENVVTAKLSHELQEFGNKYRRYFSSQKIGNERILAVLLHASMYTYIEDRELPSHCAYTVIYEIHSEPSSKRLFKDMMSDVLSPLESYKNSQA